MNNERNNALTILNVLMRADDYLTTEQIVSRTGCDRKTVYNSVAALEIAGFSIDVVRETGRSRQNKYKYAGIYGF